MFASAGKAVALIFDRAALGVVLKSLGLTLALFIALLIGAEWVLHHLPTLGWRWVNLFLELAAPVFAVFGLFVLGAPVAAIFASLFLDEIAEVVEARDYAADPRPPRTPFLHSFTAGLRLAALVLLLDAVLLPLQFGLPVIAEIATILVNGALLGREYFELAALRHLSRGAADAMRRRHRGAVFGAGMVLSLLTLIPVVNLFAPLFGAALMVHMFKRFELEDRSA